jgi:hypothetical protein
MRNLFFAVALLSLTACPGTNPYTVAHQTITIGKAVTNMTDSAFTTFVEGQKSECHLLGPDTDPKVIACLKKVQETADIWTKVYRIANASWSEADAIVTVAEQKHQGLPVDWMTPLKQGVCVVATALDFLPASVKKHVEAILNAIKTFTCEATTTKATK